MKLSSLFMIIGTAALLASCSKEDSSRQPSEFSNNGFVIEACQEGWNTKTSLDGESGKVFWNPGDEINVFFGNSGSVKFVSQNKTKSGSASFISPQPFLIGSIEDDSAFQLTGLYPYNPEAVWDNGAVTTALPEIQQAAPETFADGLFITMGQSGIDDFSMGFYNVCGGVRFRVAEEGIRAIHFKGNYGEYLAGKAKISFGSDGVPVVNEVIDGKTEVVIECQEEFVPGVWYYMVTLPVKLESGYTVTFEKGSYVAEYSSDSSVSISRSVFSSLDQKDSGLEWTFDSVYIPDANFRAYCLNNFDSDGDGKISESEADAVTYISVQTDEIYSLKGIESFKNLESLDCYGVFIFDYNIGEYVSSSKLESLDVSKNTALKYLNCNCNQLSSLDVSKNTLLESLYCEDNLLTSLDISKNTALTDFSCQSNQLTSLDVGKNTFLGFLNCRFNQLRSLDVSKNTSLASLYCEGNQLTSLDVSKNTLYLLDCAYNQLTCLDLSNNTSLKEVYCYNNQLTSLDVSCNIALMFLYCYDNPDLKEIWLNEGQEIAHLSCDTGVKLMRKDPHKIDDASADSNESFTIDSEQGWD